jgi:hypothetical protein
MIKKIALIVVVVIVSIVLLGVFILYNFPYDTLTERVAGVIRSQTGFSLSVGDTRYRFPLKVRLTDVRITGENPALTIEIREAIFRLGLFGENLSLSGNGYLIASDSVEVKGSDFNFEAEAPLRHLRGGGVLSAVDTASLAVHRARVERLFITGLEFSSFMVSEVLMTAEKKEGSLVFRQGSVKSELFTVRITGSISDNRMDVRTAITPTEKFFRNYSNLGEMLASFSDDGTLRFAIQGDFRNPTVTLENATRR